MRWNVEWRFFAGRKPDGKHFHYVEFRKGPKSFRHWSIDGKFYEDNGELGSGFHIETPQFSYYFRPQSLPIEHKVAGMEYYSWPRLSDGITECWFDHHQVNEVGENWDWVGCNLDCGMTIMAVWSPGRDYADLTFNGKTIEITAKLDNRGFYVAETGMCIILDDTQLIPPTTRDIIHKPTYGRPYSEWAFDVVSHSKIIGTGIREKTFKEV